MKVKLGVGDRLHLSEILPIEATLITVRILRELRERIELSAADIKTYGVKQVKSGVAWNVSVKPMSFTFADVEVTIIREALAAADAAGTVKIGMLDLYDMFVGDTDGEDD